MNTVKVSIVKLGSQLILSCMYSVSQKRITYFQMAVTHFRLSKLQKKGMFWKELEQTF